jgi:secreted trypsin-like serine protease
VRQILAILLIALSVRPALAMIGGTPTSHPSEVQFGMCTGTMIAPNLLLTAAHCVLLPNESGEIQEIAKPGKSILITVYNGSSGTQAKRTYLTRVKNWAVHPSWSRSLKEQTRASADAAADSVDVSDVGLIVLQDQIPTSYSLPPVATESFNGKRLNVFGAGCLQLGAQHTIGELRTASVSVTKEDSNRILIDTDDSLTGRPAGLCRGDSGGGIFVGDQIVAVNSIMAGALKPGAMPAYGARLDRPEVIAWLKRALAYKPTGTVAAQTPSF